MKINKKPSLSDTELVKGCIKGDRNCQSLFYHKFARKMYGVCLRYCNNPESVDDLLQEGFIKVFNKIKSFRFEGSLEGWVRRIMVNNAIDSLKVTPVIVKYEDADESAFMIENNDVIDDLSAQEILNLINELPMGCRLVFNMYVIEGYDHNEISELLEISVGTSKSQLSRAKMLLRKKLLVLESSALELYASEY
jgi:RNA polymerase sigma factor (sigma-70 family)